MNPTWLELITTLGQSESSIIFKRLILNIDENAIVTEEPEEYNSAHLRTKTYEFFKSGLAVSFRLNKVNHMYFYIQEHSGYKSYSGELDAIHRDWDQKKVLNALGEPTRSGGGYEDKLIGYIQKWVKYERENYAIHIAFGQNEKIWSVAIMQSP